MAFRDSLTTPSLCQFHDTSSDDDNPIVSKLKTDKAILKEALKHALAKGDKYYNRAMIVSQAHREEVKLRKKLETQFKPTKSPDHCEIVKYAQFVTDKVLEIPDYHALYLGRLENSESLLSCIGDRNYPAALLKSLQVMADVLLFESWRASPSKRAFDSQYVSTVEPLETTSQSLYTSVSVLHQSFDKSVQACNEFTEVKTKTPHFELQLEGQGTNLSETKSLLEALTIQNDKLAMLNQQISQSISRPRRASQGELPMSLLQQPTKPDRKHKSMSGCFADLPSSICLETSEGGRSDINPRHRTKHSLDMELRGLLDDSSAAEIKRVIEQPSFTKNKVTDCYGKGRTVSRHFKVLDRQPLIPRKSTVRDFICAGDVVDT